MRLLLIKNPSAGSHESRVAEDTIQALSSFAEVDELVTESEDELRAAVVEAAAPCDLVVVSGGDGSLNLAVDALAQDEDEMPPLALLPSGTGNDLARTLALPLDPVAAAHALQDAQEVRLDLARATGPNGTRYFINACMGGFSVSVDRAISDDVKARLGPAAFWWGGAKTLTDVPRYTITLQGKRVEDAVAAGVGNGRTCGGGIEVWPAADPTDGSLDAVVLSAGNVADMLRLGARLRSGEHPELEQVVDLRGERIEIDSDPPMEFNADGELPGLRTPLVFEIAGSVRFRVPRR